MSSIRSFAAAFLAAGVLVASGCQDPSEARYGSAAKDLSETRLEVERLAAELAQAEVSAQRAEERVERSRTALIRSKETLAKAEGRLANAATDEVLFRTIQRRLLEDRKLRGTAIAVRVDRGAVTLSGSVESDALRQRVGLLVEEAPAVKLVDNQVVVSTPGNPSGN